MTEKKFATEQVRRFLCYDKWLFSAENKPVVDELVLAAMVATSDTICFAVIDEWVTRQEKLPTPATLRRLMYEENAKYIEAKRSCPHCDGSGFVTRWYLVTYRGKTVTAMRSELLPDVGSNEQAQEFAAHVAANPLGDNIQTVLSGAAPCVCLPPSHHARIGFTQ